jgi:hypothetical protein
MGFENPNWAEVNPVPPITPEGTYTFQVLGGKSEPNRLVVTSAIADGEFAGKRVTFSFPTDAVNSEKWSKRLFKRFEIALGEDVLDEEAGQEELYLNRVAGTLFTADVKHRTYDYEGEERTTADLKLGSIRTAG